MKKMIEDLMKECPCKGSWCFFVELINHVGLNDRQIAEIRLIYDYKWIVSEREKRDMGEKYTIDDFIAKGYAEKFAGIYKEGMTHDELKKKLFG